MPVADEVAFGMRVVVQINTRLESLVSVSRM